jgi:ABC-2 type transport system ATP-binding protein
MFGETALDKPPRLMQTKYKNGKTEKTGGYFMLKIERLTKTYGAKRAVDDLTVHIARGEICGFIGHNGAGKTTAIKAVCGILGFDSGEIYIGGSSIKREPLACKRRIAYIPDNPTLYSFLPGIKYLNFIADVYGVAAEARRERIHRYAGLFELTGDLAQPIAAYSHGMKQKLALISALIHEPDLMILDEPFVGLDPKASRVVKDLMREKCARGGAVFFSTHVLEVAEKLCDKVAIIKEGRLVAYGDMDRVRGDSSLETVFFELEEGAAR